jgi:hypothetical protein
MFRGEKLGGLGDPACKAPKFLDDLRAQRAGRNGREGDGFQFVEERTSECRLATNA